MHGPLSMNSLFKPGIMPEACTLAIMAPLENMSKFVDRLALCSHSICFLLALRQRCLVTRGQFHNIHQQFQTLYILFAVNTNDVCIYLLGRFCSKENCLGSYYTTWLEGRKSAWTTTLP